VSLLAIALGLFLLGLVLFVVDLMIPTGGILIAVTCMLGLAAIAAAFMHSSTAGISMIIATFLAIPAAMWVFIEYWPKTPLGKRVIVTPELAQDYVWADAKDFDPKSLVGTSGVVINELLPSGLIEIEGRRFEAFSETGPIESGKSVRVVGLDVGRLIVMEAKSVPAEKPRSSGSGLDRPANELDIESLEG
jgi:membrane-bound ClpP family serine protease